MYNPPPPGPPQSQQGMERPTRKMSNTLSFFLGLGLGAIPLFLYLSLAYFGRYSTILGSMSGLLIQLAVLGYIVVVVAAIICLIIERTRFIGYGLLIMVFVGPIVAVMSCFVAIP